MSSNKSRASPHELDNTDTIGEVAGCLNFCRPDGSLSCFNTGVKSKRVIDVVDIIIDGLSSKTWIPVRFSLSQYDTSKKSICSPSVFLPQQRASPTKMQIEIWNNETRGVRNIVRTQSIVKEITYPLHARLVDFESAPMSPVSPYHVQLPNVLRLDEFANLVNVESTTRGGQDGASFVMDVFNVLGGEDKWRCLYEYGKQFRFLVSKDHLPLPREEKEKRHTQTYRRIVKSFVTTHNAIHRSLDAVQMIESPCNLTHDIIETRTQPTARDDGSIDGFRVEVKLRPGPGTDVCNSHVRFSGLLANVGKNALVIPHQYVVLGARVAIDVAFCVLFQCEHDIVDTIALGGEIFPELFQVPKVDAVGIAISLKK